MGAGASADYGKELEKVSDEDLKKAVADMDAESRKKLVDALAKGKTAAADDKAADDLVKPAEGKAPEGEKAPEAKLEIKAGQGVKHGPWSDETFAASESEIHAPRYFKEFEDFGDDLKNFKGELILRDLLTKEMYDKFKDEKTALGVTFDKCIKGGVDKAKLGADWNVGKVGVLFGDAECLTKFDEIMRPIMMARHGDPKLPHPPPNLDGSKLIDHTLMDASYVMSTRIRTGRSIKGFPLPPSISADQRKELEGIVVGALDKLDGELKGEYFPLAGSTTYAPKPTALTKKRRNHS